MYKNGVPVNPQKVKIPKAAPLPAGQLAEFRAAVATFLVQFEEKKKGKAVAGNF
jgi:hypothetical protein